MFRKACKTIRESVYGVLCQSPTESGQMNFGNGTAFMIAPGICATAAHVLHIGGDRTKPLHQKIEVIRSPDIGKGMLPAKLIAEDLDRDLALIQLANSDITSCLTLYTTKLETGTSVGALGFPLASIGLLNGKTAFNLVERFQGSFISAYQKFNVSNTVVLNFYETDSVVYGGSSGCPGFTLEEKVFGMVVSTVSIDNSNKDSARLNISRWVPSMEIIAFAAKQNITHLLSLAF